MSDQRTDGDLPDSIPLAIQHVFDLLILNSAERLGLQPKGIDAPGAFTRKAAAKYIGVSTSTFDLLRPKPGFPAPIEIHGMPRWRRDDLDRWLRRQPPKKG